MEIVQRVFQVIFRLLALAVWGGLRITIAILTEIANMIKK